MRWTGRVTSARYAGQGPAEVEPNAAIDLGWLATSATSARPLHVVPPAEVTARRDSLPLTSAPNAPAEVGRGGPRSAIRSGLAEARDRLVAAWPRYYDRGQWMACQRLSEALDEVEELLSEASYRDALAEDRLARTVAALDEYADTGTFNDPRLTADRGRIPPAVDDSNSVANGSPQVDDLLVDHGGSISKTYQAVQASLGREPTQREVGESWGQSVSGSAYRTAKARHRRT
jgi:hypothetical protein